MALVGMLTAIDGIKSGLTNQFSTMGANSFNLKNRGANVHFGKRGKQQKPFRIISYGEATEFKKRFLFPASVSLGYNASWAASLHYMNKKSNPNIQVMGSDENYLKAAGFSIDEGRNFSPNEVESGAGVVLLGKELKDKFFKNTSAVNKNITIGNAKYKVIGTLADKGSSMGFGGDRQVIIPMENARKNFPRDNASYVITIALSDVTRLESAIGEARMLFRNVRKVEIKEPDNFEILRSDSITQKLFENLCMVTLAATIIAFITLLGAGIGLMNIMLVSVTERTKEIGTRKALGATKSNIRTQFLVEAIIICILGGAGGIVLGIILGNVVGSLVGAGFLIPWNWMLLGVSLCFLVGLISGIYPAAKASRLEPIEALRHE